MIPSWLESQLMLSHRFAFVLVFPLGCNDSELPEDDHKKDSEAIEIVENLEAAGFPSTAIEIHDDHRVTVGGDAHVTLQASRELAAVSSPSAFRQYRTNNLLAPTIDEICIDGPKSAVKGVLSTGLNAAIANYNSLNLQFQFRRGSGAGCDAQISISVEKLDDDLAGLSGFPSGGEPYNSIIIDKKADKVGFVFVTWLFMHELGHTIGLRHSDVGNLAVSCGGADRAEYDELGVGTVHIPGTPTEATLDGSIMNACPNGGSVGAFTASDITALTTLYPPIGPQTCSIFVQDCINNHDKCAPTSAGPRCVPTTFPQFDLNGDACELTGPAGSGQDTCSYRSACIRGTCVQLCEGTVASPSCPDPSTTCEYVQPDWPVCVQYCDLSEGVGCPPLWSCAGDTCRP